MSPSVKKSQKKKQGPGTSHLLVLTVTVRPPSVPILTPEITD